MCLNRKFYLLLQQTSLKEEPCAILLGCGPGSWVGTQYTAEIGYHSSDTGVRVGSDPGRGNSHSIWLARHKTSSTSDKLVYISNNFHSSLRSPLYTDISHMYAYKGECWCTCPYTIIAFSVNGYVLFTAFDSLSIY